MPDRNRVADALETAADVLKKRGWFRTGCVPAHTTVNLDTCEVCVLAAINVATGARPTADFTDDRLNFQAANALADFLGYGWLEDHNEIIDVIGDGWNDSRGGAEHVITALRGAAAAERGRTNA